LAGPLLKLQLAIINVCMVAVCRGLRASEHAPAWRETAARPMYARLNFESEFRDLGI
jgi:hypothetical protein